MNDDVVVEVGKPVHNSERPISIKLSVLAVVNIMDAYDGYT